MLHPWPETYLRNKGQSHYCLLSNLFLSLCIEWNIISIIYLTLQPTPSFTISFLMKGLWSFVLPLFLHFLWVLLDAQFTESLATSRRLLRSFRHLVRFCYGFVSSKDTQHINGITLLTSEWPLGQMFRPLGGTGIS